MTNRLNGSGPKPLRLHAPKDLRLWRMLFRTSADGAPIVSQVQSSESMPCVVIELPTGVPDEATFEFLTVLFKQGAQIEGGDDEPST